MYMVEMWCTQNNQANHGLYRLYRSWWIDDLISEFVHCASGNREAYFGGGTKLTVLGKKYYVDYDKHWVLETFSVLCKKQTNPEGLCSKKKKTADEFVLQQRAWMHFKPFLS